MKYFVQIANKIIIFYEFSRTLRSIVDNSTLHTPNSTLKKLPPGIAPERTNY